MSRIPAIRRYPEKIQKAILLEWEAYNLTQPGWWGDISSPKPPHYLETLLGVEPSRLYKFPAKSSLVKNMTPATFWKAILVKKHYDLMTPFYFPCEEDFETVTVDNEIFHV